MRNWIIKFPPAEGGAGSPFEGGVVGMIDYHIYTVFYFPTGVVDYGRKFRRQHSIGNLIADSFYPSEKLVIELY